MGKPCPPPEILRAAPPLLPREHVLYTCDEKKPPGVGIPAALRGAVPRTFMRGTRAGTQRRRGRQSVSGQGLTRRWSRRGANVRYAIRTPPPAPQKPPFPNPAPQTPSSKWGRFISTGRPPPPPPISPSRQALGWSKWSTCQGATRTPIKGVPRWFKGSGSQRSCRAMGERTPSPESGVLEPGVWVRVSSAHYPS
ncbi:hypothetical protein GWK47_044085 [Chionoecetes opilio]|uniref:Uncharacterized protein n=1 Tax=Chionoecetes opilio TaxID=41210 RepID=A0A8J4YGA4_CHIOP|nr:hypothetical protein GWK47_044085 [Chionoecetes opilio]